MIHSKVRRFFKVILVIVVLGAAGIAAYLQHPLFGKHPDGVRLATLGHSPNYVDGIFLNKLDTPLLTTDESRFSVMLSNAFRKKAKPRPSGAIPTIKTNLKALDVSQDLVIWMGHSSYFLQLGGQRILIDPVFSENAAPLPLANVAFEGTSIYAAEDMPEIDVLLITHDHYDHLDYQSMQTLKGKVKQVIVGLGVGAHFESWNYDMSVVREADWYDAIKLPSGLEIVATPARHFSGRTFTRDKTLWLGFALMSDQRRIFFSGDSGYAPHFAEVGRQYGPFDWVALDSGQYDLRWENVHMNPEQAAQAADDLKAKVFTPAHAGRFSLSPHNWDDPFKRIMSATQGKSYEVWTPMIGRVMYLDKRAQEFTRWWETVE